MEIVKLKEEIESENKERNGNKKTTYCYYSNILQVLLLCIILGGIVYLLFHYIQMKIELNALLKKQNDLTLNNLSIEESIKEIKMRVEKEKEEANSIKNNNDNEMNRVRLIKDQYEATKAEVEVYNSKMIQWQNRIQQEEEMLAKAQKQNELLKQTKPIEDNLLSESKLIKTVNDKELIEGWAGKKLKAICYSTQFGFSLDLLIRGCGDSSPTLVVVGGTNEIIIGGFTYRKWVSEYEEVDMESFLFSLTQKQKYQNKARGFPVSSKSTSLSFGEEFSVVDMTAFCNPLISTKNFIIEAGLGLSTENDQVPLTVIEVFSFK